MVTNRCLRLIRSKSFLSWLRKMSLPAFGAERKYTNGFPNNRGNLDQSFLTHPLLRQGYGALSSGSFPIPIKPIRTRKEGKNRSYFKSLLVRQPVDREGFPRRDAFGKGGTFYCQKFYLPKAIKSLNFLNEFSAICASSSSK